MPLTPVELMQRAIDVARAGAANGQSPFGCAIARGEQVLAVAHNTVRSTVDITAHAEVNAIRQACQATGDIFLAGAVVATTCEPCPMCLAALHWARVADVYFGATIADAARAGFNEMHLSADEIVRRSGSSLRLHPGTLDDACRQLFEDWKQRPGRAPY